ISLLVTGGVTFQNGLRSLVTPSSSPQLNDRLSSRPPASTGIRSHPHQSSTDLRLGDKLDRIGHCIFSAEPACANRNPGSRANQRRLGLASVRIRRGRVTSTLLSD